MNMPFVNSDFDFSEIALQAQHLVSLVLLVLLGLTSRFALIATQNQMVKVLSIVLVQIKRASHKPQLLQSQTFVRQTQLL
jgi:hypothetical protein